nr:uncharacterized protein LOC109155052 [Ipomoea batatas]
MAKSQRFFTLILNFLAMFAALLCTATALIEEAPRVSCSRRSQHLTQLAAATAAFQVLEEQQQGGISTSQQKRATVRPPAIPTVVTSSINTNAANETRAVFDPNDTASPLFLHPNENPSLILVSTVLNGRNYHPWARAMEMALLSKNKLGFVDGTIEVPSIDDVKFPYWKRCNNMVSTWITRSVSPEIAQTILWLGTAARIWSKLKARFSESDIFRISDLHAEVHQIRQGDLSVSAYFAKLQLFKQLLHRDIATQSSPLDVTGGVTPQANLIAANFAPNSQLEESDAHDDNLSESPANDSHVSQQQEQPRRSSRQVSRPAYLKDYSCTLPATRTSPHTLSAVLSYDKFLLHMLLFSFMIPSGVEEVPPFLSNVVADFWFDLRCFPRIDDFWSLLSVKEAIDL